MGLGHTLLMIKPVVKKVDTPLSGQGQPSRAVVASLEGQRREENYGTPQCHSPRQLFPVLRASLLGYISHQDQLPPIRRSAAECFRGCPVRLEPGLDIGRNSPQPKAVIQTGERSRIRKVKTPRKPPGARHPVRCKGRVCKCPPDP